MLKMLLFVPITALGLLSSPRLEIYISVQPSLHSIVLA